MEEQAERSGYLIGHRVLHHSAMVPAKRLMWRSAGSTEPDPAALGSAAPAVASACHLRRLQLSLLASPGSLGQPCAAVTRRAPDRRRAPGSKEVRIVLILVAG
jgi:hypothetical protein